MKTINRFEGGFISIVDVRDIMQYYDRFDEFDINPFVLDFFIDKAININK